MKIQIFDMFRMPYLLCFQNVIKNLVIFNFIFYNPYLQYKNELDIFFTKTTRFLALYIADERF